MKAYLLIAFFSSTVFGFTTQLINQQPTALEIITKADEKMRGKSSYAEMTMTIVRPKWAREMSMKSWSFGDENALILVTAPQSEAGQATLKRDQEIWSWQPSIDRIIKLPPSMMLQSWMGSDFTNDDLVKESSIINDYTHKLAGDTIIGGRKAWKIILTPKDGAAVVWGSVISFVDQAEYIQLRSEFYDEDGYLINIMIGSEIKELGGKILATKMEMIPVEEDGHKTIITYHTLKFDIDIDNTFFSIQNMKRIR